MKARISTCRWPAWLTLVWLGVIGWVVAWAWVWGRGFRQ